MIPWEALTPAAPLHPHNASRYCARHQLPTSTSLAHSQSAIGDFDQRVTKRVVCTIAGSPGTRMTGNGWKW